MVMPVQDDVSENSGAWSSDNAETRSKADESKDTAADS